MVRSQIIVEYIEFLQAASVERCLAVRRTHSKESKIDSQSSIIKTRNDPDSRARQFVRAGAGTEHIKREREWVNQCDLLPEIFNFKYPINSMLIEKNETAKIR